jgi:hypothetical protein
MSCRRLDTPLTLANCKPMLIMVNAGTVMMHSGRPFPHNHADPRDAVASLQSLKVDVGFESVAAAATHSESVATSESDPKLSSYLLI